MEGFWRTCLSQLEKELPAQQFTTWIRPLKIDVEAASPGEIRLRAPNRFVLQWVKERFAPRIEAMGSEYFSAPVKLTLALEAVNVIPAPHSLPVPDKPPVRQVETSTGPATARPPVAERSGLITEFSFDNFVAGKANQLARAAAMQVGEHPGTSYNPLFIYGGVGLGKTHLIHAVGNEVLKHRPETRSEEHTSELQSH